MRLSEITIGEFKNLRDLHIDFDESSPYTVLVGENGAGKSNLIEAITLVFRNLDLDLAAPFSFSLRYKCRDHYLKIEAQKNRSPRIWVREDAHSDFRRLSKRRFMADDENGRPVYRPTFVFGYYSGPSDRLSALYERHRNRFYSWIIKPQRDRKGSNVDDPNSLRRLFYAQTLHGQFALLAFFMTPESSPDDDRSFLREHLQIDGLDSVLFALREPPWKMTRRGGDPRFWKAEGEVRDFLGRLYDASMLPVRMQRRIQADLATNPTAEFLYLFLPDQQALERVYRTYSDQYAFFTALESTHMSKVLGEVRTRVRLTPAAGSGRLTYRELSEGEQQLLLVLGLLKFTARDEALFLLDEPDTHLNPVWSTQYLGFLDRFIRLRVRGDSCHIVMSSHDPLVFAGLQRPQVRILRRATQGRVVAEVPDEDPRGMGVAAILTSDLFRLRSTLDPQTQEELDRLRILSMKELTPDEEAELHELNARLNRMALTKAARDPLYELFIRAWTEREDPAWREIIKLTPDQRRDRAILAAEIVEQLRREHEEV